MANLREDCGWNFFNNLARSRSSRELVSTWRLTHHRELPTLTNEYTESDQNADITNPVACINRGFVALKIRHAVTSTKTSPGANASLKLQIFESIPPRVNVPCPYIAKLFDKFVMPSEPETSDNRLKWFHECLAMEIILPLNNPLSTGFIWNMIPSNDEVKRSMIMQLLEGFGYIHLWDIVHGCRWS